MPIESQSMEVDGVRIILESQSEGGYVATSPDHPELITQGDTLEEVEQNVKTAILAVRELKQELLQMT